MALEKTFEGLLFSWAIYIVFYCKVLCFYTKFSALN